MAGFSPVGAESFFLFPFLFFRGVRVGFFFLASWLQGAVGGNGMKGALSMDVGFFRGLVEEARAPLGFFFSFSFSFLPGCPGWFFFLASWLQGAVGGNGMKGALSMDVGFFRGFTGFSKGWSRRREYLLVLFFFPFPFLLVVIR
jgi:hypothetical protein